MEKTKQEIEDIISFCWVCQGLRRMVNATEFQNKYIGFCEVCGTNITKSKNQRRR